MTADTAPTGAMAVIATLFEVRTGQHLAANRSWRLDTALKPLLRDRGLETIDALVVQLLDGKDSMVGDRIVEVLLNQETSFFRDGPVIDAAVEAIAALEPYRPGMRTRIWSAGCSFGQEPLSLAMAFAERDGAMPEIVATDLSEGAIQRARSGRFSQFEIQRGLPIRRMIRWFDGAGESGGEGAGEEWTAKAELLRHVAFRRQNLVADRPPAGPFDAVFCRNVLFYLTPTHRAQVLRSIASVLRPGGLLVLGAGETVLGQTELFEPSRRFRGLYETLGPMAAPKGAPVAAVRRAG